MSFKEKAIAALEELKGHGDIVTASTIVICQEAIRRLPEDDGWISVKKRLPEDDERLHFYDDGRMRFTTVLTCTDNGVIVPKNRLIVRNSGDEYLDKNVTDGWIWSRYSGIITHWMPLPEPPKEVG